MSPQQRFGRRQLHTKLTTACCARSSVMKAHGNPPAHAGWAMPPHHPAARARHPSSSEEGSFVHTVCFGSPSSHRGREDKKTGPEGPVYCVTRRMTSAYFFGSSFFISGAGAGVGAGAGAVAVPPSAFGAGAGGGAGCDLGAGGGAGFSPQPLRPSPPASINARIMERFMFFPQKIKELDRLIHGRPITSTYDTTPQKKFN